jgi:hypothetical protein
MPVAVQPPQSRAGPRLLPEKWCSRISDRPFAAHRRIRQEWRDEAIGLDALNDRRRLAASASRPDDLEASWPIRIAAQSCRLQSGRSRPLPGSWR